MDAKCEVAVPDVADVCSKERIQLRAEHIVVSTENLSYEECLLYFKDILQTEFPECSFRENVPVVELVGELNATFKLYETRPYQAYKAEWGAPYSFVIYKDNRVVAAMMIGERRVVSRRVKYLISKMYMKKLQLPYIPFYTEFKNEVGYTVSRIAKHLNDSE